MSSKQSVLPLVFYVVTRTSVYRATATNGDIPASVVKTYVRDDAKAKGSPGSGQALFGGPKFLIERVLRGTDESHSGSSDRRYTYTSKIVGLFLDEIKANQAVLYSDLRGPDARFAEETKEALKAITQNHPDFIVHKVFRQLLRHACEQASQQQSS